MELGIQINNNDNTATSNSVLDSSTWETVALLRTTHMEHHVAQDNTHTHTHKNAHLPEHAVSQPSWVRQGKLTFYRGGEEGGQEGGDNGMVQKKER